MKVLQGASLVVWAVATLALGIIGVWQLSSAEEKIEHVEQHVSIIHHEIVTLPCAHGDDAKCRQFLEILLSNATKKQLERLLFAKKIKLTPEKVREIENLLHRHHQAMRYRKGVMPGKGKGKEESQEPSTPHGKQRRSRSRPKRDRLSTPGIWLGAS